MKNFKLKKLVAVALTVMTIVTVSPVGASAAWKQDSHGWWNTEGNSYSKGWRTIGNNWYYFGSDGYMRTGWAKDNGTWYYMQPSGAMKTGWVYNNGTWYYMQSSGAMKIGWVYDKGTWYFTSESGAMQTGVVEVNGKVYYFAQSGAMATGKVTINGVIYTFAASGEAIGTVKPTPTLAFKIDGPEVKPTPIPTPPPTPTPDDKSHHNSGTNYVALSQEVIDAQYKSATQITKPIEISKNADGTLIQPTFSFTPGPYAEKIYATGKSYTVTKDVYVTLNGKDAYIKGTYKDGYTIEAGQTGTVTITASISVYDSTNGKLYYVTPSSVETVKVN
ncbi:cell wall-binding protein [Clostridium beijerinckii]|nr:cell wall-binding protein [Clostridium beijerinckii]